MNTQHISQRYTSGYHEIHFSALVALVLYRAILQSQHCSLNNKCKQVRNSNVKKCYVVYKYVSLQHIQNCKIVIHVHLVVARSTSSLYAVQSLVWNAYAHNKNISLEKIATKSAFDEKIGTKKLTIVKSKGRTIYWK